MTSKRASDRERPTSSQKIADPAKLLAAAQKAPAVFNIAAYFRAIYVMRQKGYSWRDLESWAAKFGIKISAVHLRRLYVQEDARLAVLSAQELAAQGFTDDMIADFLRRSDPTERLTAPDPDDAALMEKRRIAALEYGLSEEEIDGADLSKPIKLGDRIL